MDGGIPTHGQNLGSESFIERNVGIIVDALFSYLNDLISPHLRTEYHTELFGNINITPPEPFTTGIVVAASKLKQAYIWYYEYPIPNDDHINITKLTGYDISSVDDFWAPISSYTMLPAKTQHIPLSDPLLITKILDFINSTCHTNIKDEEWVLS